MYSKNQNKLPYLVLRKSVIFPGEKVSLVVDYKEAIEAVRRSIENNFSNIIIFFKKNGEFSQIGILAKITQYWSLSSSVMGIIVDGVERVKITGTEMKEGKKEVKIEGVELLEETPEISGSARNVLNLFKKILNLEGKLPMFFMEDLKKERITAEKISNIISAYLKIDFREKLELLEECDLQKRLNRLNTLLVNELNILETEKKIEKEVKKEITKTQKEHILKEQMKAIERELGIFEEYKEYENLEKKIKTVLMPADVKNIALKEFARLKKMPSISTEASYIRTYLDLILELPWEKRDKTTLDLKKAKSILDRDHYGLNKAKERVLEYLAVYKLTKGKKQATIMCFVGPPGTGKTSVGKSIAEALGRKFYRISLGGIRDEAEIRGHRRTYIGALPGRIIQGIRNVGTKNPVFMLDEIDKIGLDFRGDPSAALLEVLDKEQNNKFSDHYLEIPFDLSEVIFITTANILDPIPPALRDRMEVIEFPGYTEYEKFQIAKKFLIPRVINLSGLKKQDLFLEGEALKKIINRYTKEAGVRNLERKLAEIARKIAKHILEKGRKKNIINVNNLSKYLGPEEYEITMGEKKNEIGVATGLAWTPFGGEIIFIEVSFFKGSGKIILTGQLGKTMKESAKAALSYVRAKSEKFGLPSDFFSNSDVHIHIPSGAIKKDGPSAGVALAIALISALTKKEIRKEVALTGEVTLLGKILEVGGIKEKVLAAHRGGVKTIILPKVNKKNLVDIPKEIKKDLTFLFVDSIAEAENYIFKKY